MGTGNEFEVVDVVELEVGDVSVLCKASKIGNLVTYF